MNLLYIQELRFQFLNALYLSLMSRTFVQTLRRRQCMSNLWFNTKGKWMIIKNYNIDFPQFVIWFSGFLYKGENWKGYNIIVAWLLTIVLNKDLAVPEFQIRTLFFWRPEKWNGQVSCRQRDLHYWEEKVSYHFWTLWVKIRIFVTYRIKEILSFIKVKSAV